MKFQNCIIFKIILFYLMAETLCTHAEAHHSKRHSSAAAHKATAGTADNCTTPLQQGLCSDFRALRNLIPQNQLIGMTAKHYKYDHQFRHAMNFIRTNEFKTLADEIDESNAYRRMLQRFQENDVDTTDIDSVMKIINCLLLPIPEDVMDNDNDNDNHNNRNSGKRRRGRAQIQARSLQSYAREIMNAMPHDKVRSTLVENLDKSSQFNKFYETIRNPSFHQQIMRDFFSAELRRVLRTLRQNFIDVRCLIEDVFKIFSWGPVV